MRNLIAGYLNHFYHFLQIFWLYSDVPIFRNSAEIEQIPKDPKTEKFVRKKKLIFTEIQPISHFSIF
jgi:hypothetical protein